MKEKDSFGRDADVSPNGLRSMGDALRLLAEQHDATANWMETAGIPAVRAKNLKTAANCLVHYARFLGGVTTAVCDNISAEGVRELEGGIAILLRAMKRKTEDLDEPPSKQLPPVPDPQTIHDKAKAAGNKYVEGGRKAESRTKLPGKGGAGKKAAPSEGE